MLTQEESNEVDYLVNTEYMTQAEDAWLESPLEALKTFVPLLNLHIQLPETVERQILEYCVKFGQFKNLKVPNVYKRKMYVINYGEDEVQAMEEIGEVSFE